MHILHIIKAQPYRYLASPEAITDRFWRVEVLAPQGRSVTEAALAGIEETDTGFASGNALKQEPTAFWRKVQTL